MESQSLKGDDQALAFDNTIDIQHSKLGTCESSTSPGDCLGLLAGSGRFPLIVAEKARALRIPVVCVGIRGEAPAELADLVNQFYWAGVARLGRMIRCFRRAGVKRIVMAGKIQKRVMHTPWRLFRLVPDLRTLQFWFFRRRPNNKDDSLLLGIIDEFARDGMEFASALDICPELLVRAGTLTQRSLTSSEVADVAFGWDLAKEMGRLDVGQSVAVKERAVLAVEAIEGTDQAIARAGALCPARGFVVVKVAKPQQDMRFDVPTVGMSTIETMHKAGGRVLAIEAGKTIVIDDINTIDLANRLGITIVAR
jgi:UDP-2,3-diacylglucosamine hydrolase